MRRLLAAAAGLALGWATGWYRAWTRHDDDQAAAPTCTCPDIDVSTLSELPGSRTVKGHDPDCPVHKGQ